MAEEVDEKFFNRADAHIHLSNGQLGEISAGQVSASMMFALSRFNAWVSACGFESSEQMAATREEVITYFTTEYRKMLEENLDDYITHFDKYMASGKEKS